MAQASAYNEKYHVDWAWSLALKGATDEEIAEAFHISVRTLHRWKKTHPELLTALEEGKDVADAKVKRSLYQRAVGYEAKEVTQILSRTRPLAHSGFPKPKSPQSTSFPTRWPVCTGSTTEARASSHSGRRSHSAGLFGPLRWKS